MEEIYEFNKRLSNIQYGWYDNENNLHTSLKDQFREKYQMQNISEIEKHNYAVCWDLCELERDYFSKRNIPFVTIFALLSEDARMLCHTFLAFQKNNKYYWFESSWAKMRGVREYNTLDLLLEDVRKHFYDFTSGEFYEEEKIIFYTYNQPKENIRCEEFYQHCIREDRKITLESRLF